MLDHRGREQFKIDENGESEMDNRTEDQKRLERVEEQLSILTRMVSVLLPPAYYEKFKTEQEERTAKLMNDSQQRLRTS